MPFSRIPKGGSGYMGVTTRDILGRNQGGEEISNKK